LIDKLTILEIKRERITAKNAVDNIERKLRLLARVAEPVAAETGEVADLKERSVAIDREL
jgi:hypothetical protein